MIDETINKKETRGRPKTHTSRDVQRGVYVDPDLWDAAGDLPVSRPDIIRDALLNAVSYYQSDLPKLRWQLEENNKRILNIESENKLLKNRIAELEEEEKMFAQVKQINEHKTEDAVNETLRLCRTFRKKIGHEQFSIISKLTGLDSAQIEVFVKDRKFNPTEDDVRLFLNAVVQ